jgi:chromosome segregation ATPase
MLGPARFSHIETCSLEVCRVFKRREEIDDCTSTLTTLDALIAQLRSELKDISPQQSTASASRSFRGHEGKITTDYSWVENDIPKAKRNITAKENTISTLKKMIAKRREEMVLDTT